MMIYTKISYRHHVSSTRLEPGGVVPRHIRKRKKWGLHKTVKGLKIGLLSEDECPRFSPYQWWMISH